MTFSAATTFLLPVQAGLSKVRDTAFPSSSGSGVKVKDVLTFHERPSSDSTANVVGNGFGFISLLSVPQVNVGAGLARSTRHLRVKTSPDGAVTTSWKEQLGNGSADERKDK